MGKIIKNSRPDQRGMALITVLSLATVLFMFAAVSATIINRSGNNTQETFRRESQAANIARAGLRDAIGWFKHKSSIGGAVSNPSPYPSDKPCADAAFAPAYNADPKLRETLDPDVGIVQDLILDPDKGIYGRYVVRKQHCDSADVLPSSSNYDPLAVHDITAERGKGLRGEGYAWHIVSEGIIYQRRNYGKNADGVFTTGPDTPPNRVLDKVYVESDINRLSVRKPLAPINIADPLNGDVPQSSFTDKCEVRGRDANAMLIYVGTGGGQNPSGAGPACQYETCPPPGGNKVQRTDGITHPMTVDEIFSVSQDELKSLADYVYLNVNEVDAAHYQEAAGRMNLPMAIYYLDGSSFTFTTSRPLRGSGVMFVNGDLNLQTDSFVFSGLVYVKGKLTMTDGNEISGAVVASQVACTAATKASFEYSVGIMETVRDKLALYRENTLSYATRK